MSEAEQHVERVLGGVRGFVQEMRDLDIHVGLGNPAHCVTCGEAWPCSKSGEVQT